MLGCSGAPEGDDTTTEEVSAKTSLRIPVLDANTHRPLAENNAALRAKGLETFPELIDMNLARLRDFDHLLELVDAANGALGSNLELLRQASPSDLAEGPANPHGLCYVGNARAVPKVMRDLNDSVFDQFIAVYMWKFRNETREGAAFGATGPEQVSKFPRAFQDFRGHGDDLMLVYSVTDAFDERLAVTIPRCAPTKK